MHRRSVLAALALMLGFAAGCSATQPEPAGSVRLLVSEGQRLTPEGITRVTVTVSASDMEPIEAELTLTDGVWKGVLEGIPAGTGRSFEALAYDNTHWWRYQGVVTDVTIESGKQALVAIVLQEFVFPSNPFENAVPVIDGLAVSSTEVAQGSEVTLTAVARDPNPEDSLTYTWTASVGGLSSSTGRVVRWTAPSQAGSAELTLTVSDGRGGASGTKLSLSVLSGATGAIVETSFNHVPVLQRISASSGRVDVAETTVLTVAVTDTDGDSIRYEWSASCEGTWTDAERATAQFTPSVRPSRGCNNCRITVGIRDSRGAWTSGRLSICVGPAPSPVVVADAQIWGAAGEPVMVVVPPGKHVAELMLWGAGGGGGAPGPGGGGAWLHARVPVTPGESLELRIASGGDSQGGGGGASQVLRAGQVMLVAAGGGGGGHDGCSGCSRDEDPLGGAGGGGGPVGGNGQDGRLNDYYLSGAGGGGGGMQNAGGVAGPSNNRQPPEPVTCAAPGLPGDALQGGASRACQSSAQPVATGHLGGRGMGNGSGGGGGSGWYGGGSGGSRYTYSGGGGGGGSSYAHPSVTLLATEGGNGQQPGGRIVTGYLGIAGRGGEPLTNWQTEQSTPGASGLALLWWR
ncbi:hypothetical protein HUA74_03430 [Myxococcus sp. CA051A]|uniref:Ig-like domain-containing protein n=2 Tax=unclassified Myxococcus TaxID=2648731 RepID=UPI00157B2A3F|nr:hypothetical protein [Myxococcus sp. CA051A]NTX59705.1 hypothetical protein [Myxococcus sp. CA051A]